MNELKCKVCGMTDPANVAEISALQPDYMGFIFFPRSLRYVGPDPDPALFNAVHPEVEKTAVFVNENFGKMLEIAERFGIRTLQLHGMESPETCNSLRMKGMTVIKVVPGDQVGNVQLLKDYASVSDYFLFDTPARSHGGTGRKFDWTKLDNFSSRKPFFLSGGISPEDAGQIRNLNLKGLFAVDINSRFETSPGIKDPDSVERFIKSIKNEKN